jgi:hypothetical protein
MDTYTLGFIIKVAIEWKKLHQCFPKINIDQLGWRLIELQKRYYHQEECIRTYASKVWVIECTCFKILFKYQYQRLNYFILIEKFLDEFNTFKTIVMVSHLGYINVERLI